LYYDLVRVLRGFGIPFESLSPRRRIPSKVSVVLTTEAEYPRIRCRNKVIVRGIEGTLVRVKRISEKVEGEGIVIGIDPGEQIGIAVVAMPSKALLFLTSHDVETTVSTVASIVDMNPGREVFVNIGSGAPTIRNRILHGLKGRGIRLYLVNESRTSPRSNYSRSDEIAAFKIALLKGKEVVDIPVPDPSPGEVREIQRKSRISSRGRFTLPKETARRVALGELTLEQAVKEYEKEKED